MTLGQAITYVLPGAQYTGVCAEGTKAEFDALEWNDERPKPKWKDVEAAMALTHPKYESALVELYERKASLDGAKAKAVAEGDTQAVALIDAKIAELDAEVVVVRAR